MNNQIQRLLNDAETLQTARSAFRQSPIMLQLIDALAEKKLSDTPSLVEAVYGKMKSKQYSKFENRFYKLRKKLLDTLLAGNEKPATDVFYTDEERTLAHCKQLLASGNIAEAEQTLTLLEKHCSERNIFEMLPYVYDHLIQAKQALNKLKETPAVFEQYEQSLVLYSNLGRMKMLSRKIYEVNVISGIAAAEPLFRQMDKLSRQHPDKPRFKLIYNFAAAYYKAGSASESKLIKTNVITRHLQVVKTILQNHPDMPVVNYAPDYKRTQTFRLRDMESMIAFKAFRFKEAARLMNSLLEDVTAPNSDLKKMLSNTLIVNTIHINVAAAQPLQAYNTAKFYIQFLRANKMHQQLTNAYCELASAMATLRFQPPNVSNTNLLKSILKIEQDTIAAKAEKSLGTIRFLKLKFLHFIGREQEALELTNDVYVKDHLSNNALLLLIKKTLQLDVQDKAAATMLKSIKQSLNVLKHNSNHPENIAIYIWLGLVIHEKEAAM